MGYPDEVLPEPFDHYLQEALNEAHCLNDIRATYRIIDDITADNEGKKILAENTDFKVGKIIYHELKGSEKLAFFISTAGESISRKSAEFLRGENPVLGYVYDVLGSFIAEAACDRMQQHLKEDIKEEGFNITNRYSPGYCQWDVADQHKIFSLFEEDPCGVTLTSSALMNPVKSISGVIGLGISKL
ncbi:MAG: vitamin B12 dependent-methionine synthase activation domain-containing protein [Bacteroidota bacterium]